MWIFNKKNKLVEVSLQQAVAESSLSFFLKKDALLEAIDRSTKAMEQAHRTAQFHKVRIDAAKKQLKGMKCLPDQAKPSS